MVSQIPMSSTAMKEGICNGFEHLLCSNSTWKINAGRAMCYSTPRACAIHKGLEQTSVSQPQQ